MQVQFWYTLRPWLCPETCNSNGYLRLSVVVVVMCSVVTGGPIESVAQDAGGGWSCQEVARKLAGCP
jgi:hypothetical protein